MIRGQGDVTSTIGRSVAPASTGSGVVGGDGDRLRLAAVVGDSDHAPAFYAGVVRDGLPPGVQAVGYRAAWHGLASAVHTGMDNAQIVLRHLTDRVIRLDLVPAAAIAYDGVGTLGAASPGDALGLGAEAPDQELLLTHDCLGREPGEGVRTIAGVVPIGRARQPDLIRGLDSDRRLCRLAAGEKVDRDGRCQKAHGDSRGHEYVSHVVLQWRHVAPGWVGCEIALSALEND